MKLVSGEFRITQAGQLTPEEKSDPVGEINKIAIGQFNSFTKAVIESNQYNGYLLHVKESGLKIREEHAAILEKTGIDLTVGTIPSSQHFYELQLRIHEPESTINFLKTVSDEPDEYTKASMSFLFTSIFVQLNRDYSKKKGSSDQGHNLGLSLEPFIAEFKRMSFDTTLTEEYAKHTPLTLREYVHVVNTGIVSESQEWHWDLTTKELAEKWAEAFDVLDELEKNPFAQELMVEVLASLGQAIGRGMEDLEDSPEELELKDVIVMAGEILSHYSEEDSQ